MATWNEHKLGEVADFIDYRGKTPRKTISGIPLITAKIVKNGVIHEPSEFISTEDYPKWMSRGYPQIGDVVLTTEAPLGEVAQIKDKNVALAQRIITIRGHKGIIDNGYLKYFLQSDKGQNRLKERETGTTVTGIKSAELKQVRISAPDFPTQTAIAEILSSLDDKIELNNQINQELEALAQALFKHWFIDFEFPISAAEAAMMGKPNLEGKPYKSSGGEMVESELGEIPKGWRVTNLSEICTISKESVKPFQSPGEQFSHYSIPAFDEGKLPSIELGETILSSKFKVHENSVLVSKLNPRFPRVWYVGDCNGNSICSTEFQVIRPNSSAHFEFIYTLCKSSSFTDSLISKASGTSGSHQRVRPSDMLEVQFAHPDSQLIELFHKSTKDMLYSSQANTAENLELRQLRDTLLPRLISGELEVSSATTIK